MTFPDDKFDAISDFIDAYAQQVAKGFASIDRELLAKAADILDAAYAQGGTVYVCGNGGSAAISNHFHCDHLKGVQTDTAIKPRVVSLSSTVETLTAIANDISFDEVFVYQLRTMAHPGDVLVTVSSSGDSENVVRAAKWAAGNNVGVISFTGFSGGRTAELADVHLHVDADNYGVIEDVHQSIMHVLAQFLRLKKMDAGLISERKF
ncbi:MAG: SIS domain-containing protein [Rhodospirillales bacterium]|nr:SIS domain-containing protein [Rhodospirillales bacterium]